MVILSTSIYEMQNGNRNIDSVKKKKEIIRKKEIVITSKLKKSVSVMRITCGIYYKAMNKL